MRDSALVEGKIRYAREQFLEPPLPVDAADRLIAVGANLVNVISRKIGWLEDFKRRLETRETLREIRS